MKLRLLIISVVIIHTHVLAQAPATQPGASATTRPANPTRDRLSVLKFGATGDGQTIDSPAINAAIEAASAGGGGTVYFPPGTYASYSIRLMNNITLELDPGAKIVAARPVAGAGYDAPEPNPEARNYQDAGHSHWHNSLIWGEKLENIAIIGAGMIDGSGLSTGDNGNNGNKAIALKLCRNVTLRDIKLFRGGHFAILATGVDNFTIDNVVFDTNRDAFDVDCCRNVRISNCSINAPNDDGLVLKSSFGLGFARACENITITNCLVSGFEIGTLLDGTYQPLNRRVPDGGGPTGRIKFGTESNGGFKNITISNCVFDHCRGLALETVDGGLLEDVTISNITMRTTSNSPLFLRLGARMRGPAGTEPGKLRRINISNIVAYDADPRYASIISGTAGNEIEDVRLSNIRIYYQGGGTAEQAAIQPPEIEQRGGYPEPQFFGVIPAYGFFIRHVKGIELNNVEISYIKDEARPPFILDDVKGATFRSVKAQHGDGVPNFVLKNVEGFRTRDYDGLPDTQRQKVEQEKF